MTEIKAIPSGEYETLINEFKKYSYSIAHDLSGPLRAIVEFSRLLNTRHHAVLNDEAKTYLSFILENGEKMQQMMAALMDYIRINHHEVSYTKINCTTLLEQCLEMLKDKITSSGATIKLGPLPIISADELLLLQLFMVLLDNGLNYHLPEKKPHITISAEETTHQWVFTVRDEGMGVDQPFHEVIFDPLRRLHNSKEYPGVGMGLTIAKKIVQLHNGNMRIDSALNQGSVFTFSIAKPYIVPFAQNSAQHHSPQDL